MDVHVHGFRHCGDIDQDFVPCLVIMLLLMAVRVPPMFMGRVPWRFCSCREPMNMDGRSLLQQKSDGALCCDVKLCILLAVPCLESGFQSQGVEPPWVESLTVRESTRPDVCL